MSDDRLIFDTARRTLNIEAEVLGQLKSVIDDTFAQVARTLLGCRGRVIVSGVGKSALVAQKMSATFNSTGTPSLFVHGADAIHGDLGAVLTDDVVVALSKSGETAEMRALLPLVRGRCATVVAIVCREGSFLAKQADLALVLPVPREADPHDLAPTASALATMAIGDALASALVAMRGFSTEDFGALHPGGSLGKQLTLTLADLACRNDAPRVSPEAPIQEVVVAMSSGRLGATAVVDESSRLLGIITDGDLRRALGRGMEVLRLSAKQLMTPQPLSAPRDELAAAGLALVQARNINQLLLVDEAGTYAGLVHLHDFVREGLV